MSTAAFGCAASTNLVAMVWDLARLQYSAAGLQSLALLLVAIVGAVMPKLYAILDAQIACWSAQRQSAVIMHAELVRQKAEFDRRVAETMPAEGRAH